MVKLVEDNRGRVLAAWRQKTASIVDDAALGLVERARGSLQPSGVSDPGEAPAIQSGDLARSIDAAPGSWAGDRYTRQAGSSAEHAPVLENGGAHVAARPFLGPAFRAMVRGVKARLNRRA